MKKIFYVVICWVLLAGCERDFDIFIPDETTPVQTQAIDRFFEEALPDAASLQLDATAGGELTLPSWGTLLLPPQALTTEDGGSISGMVTVTVREAYRRGDWLSARLPAEAEGQLLEAAAAIQVQITQNDIPLTLAAGQRITLQLPAGDSLPTSRLFHRPANAPATVSWSILPDELPAPSEVFDADQQLWLPAYSVDSDRLGWLLIGDYAQPTAATDLCVLLPMGYDSDNTVIYAVYDQRPLVVNLPWDTESTEPRFCRDDLPAEESLTLIAVAITDEEMYYFQQRTLSLEGEIQLEWMDPAETVLPEVLEFLSGL